MTKVSERIHVVDGLRAIAVLPVILFHLNPHWLPGGYLGVDIFFVISGYLITGIIVKEISEGSFTFTGFYARRIRRILPALLVMMSAVLAAGIFICPLQLNEIARQVRAVILLNGNGNICDNIGNYWGATALADPLLHTWSLGVEEQFYLLFPLLVWLLVRYHGAARTLNWVLGLGFLSFLWFLIQSAANPPKAFYLLLPRAWELMAGAAIALAAISKVGSDNPKWKSTAAGWIGLAVITAAYVLPDYGSIFQRLRPLMAVPGVMLFLWGAKSDSGLCKALSHPGMVWVGMVSYSLYLWHWPVIVFLKTWNEAQGTSLGSWSLVFLALGLTMPLAIASYRWIEQPLRRSGLAWMILLFSGVLYAAAGLATASFGRQQLSASRDPASMQADESVGGFRGMTCRGGLYASNTASASGGKYAAIKFSVKPVPRPIDFVTIGGDQSSHRTLLVWGDSHACMLADLANSLALKLRYKATYHILDGGDPTPTVILPETGKWIKDKFREHLTESEEEINRFNELGRRLVRERPDALLFVCRYDGRSFDRMRPFFEEAARHTRLFVLQQPPVMDIADICTVDFFCFQRDREGKRLDRLRVSESLPAKTGKADFETRFLAHFSSDKNVVFIRTQDLLRNPDGSVKWWDGNGALYYIDTNHLSPFGAELLGPRIAEALLSSPK